MVKPQPPKDDILDTHVADQATAPIQAPEKSEAHVMDSETVNVDHDKSNLSHHHHHHDHSPLHPHLHLDTQGTESTDSVASHVTEDDQHVTEVSNSEHPIPKDDVSKLPANTALLPHKSNGSITPPLLHPEDAEPAPAFAHEAAHGSPVKIVKDVPEHEDKEEDYTPLFRHETGLASPARLVEDLPRHQDEEEEHAPFFRHETTAAADPIALEDVDDDEEDFNDHVLASPLFRHESMTRDHSNHHEGGEKSVPLFRHESMSPMESRLYSPGRSARSDSASSRDTHATEQDSFDDPLLEKFPTERDGIMAHLHRASSRRSDGDETLEPVPSSPLASSTRGLTAAASPSVSVAKESAEHLDCIDEDEELSSESPFETQGLGITPAPEPAAHTVTYYPERESIKEPDSMSKLSFSHSHEPVNRGPLTPPMTPIDESQKKSVVSDGNIDLKQPETPSPFQAPERPRVRSDNSTDNIASRSTSKSSLTPSPAKDDRGKATSFMSWLGKLCGDRLGSMLVFSILLALVIPYLFLRRGIAMVVGAAAAFYALTGKKSSA